MIFQRSSASTQLFLVHLCRPSASPSIVDSGKQSDGREAGYSRRDEAETPGNPLFVGGEVMIKNHHMGT